MLPFGFLREQVCPFRWPADGPIFVAMSESFSYQRFFAELKRRRVFRIAAVYGGTAFVLLQVADLLQEGLQLPQSFLTTATWLALGGFPIALLLAWLYERTPQGLIRTPDAAPDEIDEIVAQPPARRWPIGIAAATGTALLLVSAWWMLGRPDPPSATTADFSSVAVLPVENMVAEGSTQVAIGLVAASEDQQAAGQQIDAVDDLNRAQPFLVEPVDAVAEIAFRRRGTQEPRRFVEHHDRVVLVAHDRRRQCSAVTAAGRTPGLLGGAFEGASQMDLDSLPWPHLATGDLDSLAIDEHCTDLDRDPRLAPRKLVVAFAEELIEP